MTNYTGVINASTYRPALAEPFRAVLGLTMMIVGLYFGLFSEMPAQGLGLLSLMISPFVFLTDQKRPY